MKHLILAIGLMMGSFARAATGDYDNVDPSAKAGLQAAVQFVAEQLDTSPVFVQEYFQFEYHYKMVYDRQPLLVYFYGENMFCRVEVTDIARGYCTEDFK